jgi:hypothetical protein
MNNPVATRPHPVPAPAFTLASALCWLGHECPSRCAARAGDLNATVWFIRRRETVWPTPHGTLVVVDLTDSREPVAHIRRRVRDIAACTRADGILVRERRTDDNGGALATVIRPAWRRGPQAMDQPAARPR